MRIVLLVVVVVVVVTVLTRKYCRHDCVELMRFVICGLWFCEERTELVKRIEGFSSEK